jgi:hypothetical protein
MNKRGKGKKSQGNVLGMSFGTIFSILLIIFIIIIAFIVIRAFLGTQKCAQIGIFASDLQSDVTTVWKSSSEGGRQNINQIVPSNIDYVCFMNLTMPVTAIGIVGTIGDELKIYRGVEANMFFYPLENACNTPYTKIEHLNLDKMTGKTNPYCVPVENGKSKILIKMGFNEDLVTLESAK